MPKTLDRDIVTLHLADTSLYEKSTEKEFKSSVTRINKAWKSVGEECHLPMNLVQRLTTSLPSIPPTLYTLIKTHKLTDSDRHLMDPSTYKVRPIISACGGPADKVSWLLSKILSPLLSLVPVHIANVYEALTRLNVLT